MYILIKCRRLQKYEAVPGFSGDTDRSMKEYYDTGVPGGPNGQAKESPRGFEFKRAAQQVAPHPIALQQQVEVFGFHDLYNLYIFYVTSGDSASHG